MPDKPSDPLDEPDDLLAGEETTEPEDIPEPTATVLEDAPEPEAFVWEEDPNEPMPSDIEVLAEETVEPDSEGEEEPQGDDLYWTAVEDDAVDPDWHEPEDDEAPTLDWSVEEEEAINEDDWAALEEPRRLLPDDLLLIGFEELVSVPELGLTDLTASVETGLMQSIIFGEEAGEPIHTTLVIGAISLTITLARAVGPAGARLGRDVLAGRFVVNPGRRLLLSAPQ